MIIDKLMYKRVGINMINKLMRMLKSCICINNPKKMPISLPNKIELRISLIEILE